MAIIKPVDESKVFIQSLPYFNFKEHHISMLRLDVMHPIISGNKWYKLKYNIEEAIRLKAKGIISFGGAYSNHLIATAAAASANHLPSVGIVRGLEVQPLNFVLKQCQHYGMNLHFISKQSYAQKETEEFLTHWHALYPHHYFIPEGGANVAGRKGIDAIAAMIPSSFSHIILSVGSGTTLIGLRNNLDLKQQIIGFAPLKGGVYLEQELASFLLPEQNFNWCINDQFHFGGFGKITEELSLFMKEFKQEYDIELDRVYTAKMIWGLRQLLQENFFPKGASILCIHTGGLTGN
jgi:1-aminocyclopropane-1-carboxylate deaminase